MHSIAEPLVSIVFTSYNHAEYLRQAVQSIINQDFRNFELIIVDDCSTDGSREILQTYAGDARVKLHLLEKNTGSYVKASNYGARFAQGTYLLFAQCDDFADPAQLTMLLNAFRGNDTIGVAWSRSNMVNETGAVFEDDFKGREKKFRDKCSNNTLVTGSEMLRFLSYSCVLPNLSAALVKRELYTAVGGLSEKYLVASDWAFWLSMAEHTDFYYLTTPLNNFRQHETTIRSKTKIERQIVEIYSIFYEHITQYKLSTGKAFHMRTGAGHIWFSFIFSGVGPWLKCFGSVLRRTFSIEKFNLGYLFLGAMVFLREVVYNRFR